MAMTAKAQNKAQNNTQHYITSLPFFLYQANREKLSTAFHCSLILTPAHLTLSHFELNMKINKSHSCIHTLKKTKTHQYD